MSIYQFSAKTIDGKEISLEEYKGKVVLIVNTASKCGFTPQYQELQTLYEKYHHLGFEILAFPSNQFGGQELDSEAEIKEFCSLNFGVTFPMFSKVDVKGENAIPLFKYLTEMAPGLLGSESIKWNFTKFLIKKDGTVYKRYAPNTSPLKIEKDIESLLKK
jgi:glutathione peroxidase